ncbi:MAG: twitching motility protein PilT [Candidatus Omnitrophica bacterium]|nr:twitching motility protein PilT [Candidatus Omnitrophota bacterium]
MTLLFIRTFFVVLSVAIGFLVGNVYDRELIGVAVGLVGAGLLIWFESLMKQVSVRGLSSMVFGLLFGVIMAMLVADTLKLLPFGEAFHSSMRVVLTLIFSYLGAVIALRGKDEFNLIIPYVRFRRTDLKEGVILLDTSAIIDGRVTDIYRSHFLSGRLVVPRFVLHELQRLADSEDDLKRQRGRRGMEILRSMQKDPAVDVHIHEDDLTGEHQVDLKLVKLAKILEGRLCTTDFNLSRMATIQGTEVLNINDLVNSVKPVVFAGEHIDVQIIKEGKEEHQGVAYLEDGTMVVVTDGRRMLGQKARVIVTSVLQTQAGRMIFAKVEGR